MQAPDNHDGRHVVVDLQRVRITTLGREMYEEEDLFPSLAAPSRDTGLFDHVEWLGLHSQLVRRIGHAFDWQCDD